MATLSITRTADRELLLRRALQADALISGICGAAALALSGQLSPLLGIAQPWALPALGVDFLIYAAGIWLAIGRASSLRRVGMVVIALNSLWVIACAAVLAGGWLPLTSAGQWTVGATGIIVLDLIIAQAIGVRRAAR